MVERACLVRISSRYTRYLRRRRAGPSLVVSRRDEEGKWKKWTKIVITVSNKQTKTRMDVLSRQPAKRNPTSLKEPYGADQSKYLSIPTGETPRARYLHLFHLGQQIAPKSSIAPCRYGEVAQALMNLSFWERCDAERRRRAGRLEAGILSPHERSHRALFAIAPMISAGARCTRHLSVRKMTIRRCSPAIQGGGGTHRCRSGNSSSWIVSLRTLSSMATRSANEEQSLAIVIIGMPFQARAICATASPRA
jgi:hypothetical protein